MKEFIKDYVELQKHSNQWLKKHWKGYTLLCALVIGGEMVYFYKDEIKYKIEHRKALKKAES